MKKKHPVQHTQLSSFMSPVTSGIKAYQASCNMLLGKIQFPRDILGDARTASFEGSFKCMDFQWGALFQCSILNKSHFGKVEIGKCIFLIYSF